MKNIGKIFAIAMLVVGFANSNAKADDLSGSIRLKDGRTIVRINVGDSRSDRDSALRINRLERAVRDLQDQVYQLQSEDTHQRAVTVYTCALKTDFNGTFLGKGPTKVEAEANAVNSCAKAYVNFCESNTQECETSVEYK